MIESKDLRIGNLVTVFAFGIDDISKVTCISVDGVSLESKENSYVFEKYEDIKPIELTKEILLKAGFEINISSFLWAKEMKFFKEQIAFSKDLKKTMIFNSFINQSININHIKYVHSLQNLFYSLTGEELKIQL